MSGALGFASEAVPRGQGIHTWKSLLDMSGKNHLIIFWAGGGGRERN